MNKSDLESLTSIRMQEAKCLLNNGLYHGAYYLCGYAIECALKACIAKGVLQYQFPDKKLAQDSHNHDLEKLMKVANLQISFQNLTSSDPSFNVNWAVIKDWSEQFRYNITINQLMAEQLINAAENNQSGVLKWIKSHW
ncbi:TPA: HEPN domain-containing protein [Klebsiella pneumoniae]